MLIFRAWATCAMSLLPNIWNTIVTIHFHSQWRWLPHRLSKRQSLSTGLRSPGLPYSCYLLMTWLLGLNHFFVSVVTIADLITNCSAAWYKEEPRWGLKQCIVIKGPCYIGSTRVLVRGRHWGVPNTAIPQEKLANTEIPCRKSTKYRYRIYDRSCLCDVVSISHVCLFYACMHQQNFSHCEKT